MSCAAQRKSSKHTHTNPHIYYVTRTHSTLHSDALTHTHVHTSVHVTRKDGGKCNKNRRAKIDVAVALPLPLPTPAGALLAAVTVVPRPGLSPSTSLTLAPLLMLLPLLLLLCNCAFPSLARRLACLGPKNEFFLSPLPCVFCFCWGFFRFVSFSFLF